MLNYTCLQRSFLTLSTDLELLNGANKLVNKYNKDISKTFTSEISTVRSTLKKGMSKLISTSDLTKLLMVKHRSLTVSFPKVCNALLLFLTIPVTKLKIIKVYLRNTVTHDRLSGLPLHLIEQETAREG